MHPKIGVFLYANYSILFTISFDIVWLMNYDKITNEMSLDE
jgi:hypothetical protein